MSKSELISVFVIYFKVFNITFIVLNVNNVMILRFNGLSFTDFIFFRLNGIKF
jgi:hypothetical protein